MTNNAPTAAARRPSRREIAAFWDRNPVDGHENDPEERRRYFVGKEPWWPEDLRELLALPRPLLEIGVGQGNDFVPLRRAGGACFGLDLSLESLRACARQLDPPLPLAGGDARELPCATASFQSVVSFGVLHHSPDIGRSFREVHRVLKPGGVFRFMLYNRLSPKGAAVAAVRKFFRARLPESFQLRRGTALAELIHCPVLDLYSMDEIRALLPGFTLRKCVKRHFGLHHLCYLLGVNLRLIAGLDERLARRWGFYLIVEAVRR